jgi:hypothetical protein
VQYKSLGADDSESAELTLGRCELLRRILDESMRRCLRMKLQVRSLGVDQDRPPMTVSAIIGLLSAQCQPAM